MKIHNLTEHDLPAYSMVFMQGTCGPGEVLAIRHYQPGDKSIYAVPTPEDEVERWFEGRDDTILEDG